MDLFLKSISRLASKNMYIQHFSFDFKSRAEIPGLPNRIALCRVFFCPVKAEK
jgi:hypothetical protein